MKNNKIIYYIYQVYKILIFIPLFTIFTIIFSTVAVLLSILVNPNIGYWGGVLWARCSSYITPMKIIIKGRENIEKDKSYVLVANHQSYFDILVFVGFLPLNLKWVMKNELRKVPFFGIACEKVGHIFVDRSDRKAAIKSIAKAKEQIQNGTGIMFMPEGTRSRTGQLLKFKKGAFFFAKDIGLPIIPVTISGTKDILPKHTMDLFPGKVSVTIHKPIDPLVYDNDKIDQLIELVKSQVQRGLP